MIALKQRPVVRRLFMAALMLLCCCVTMGYLSGCLDDSEQESRETEGKDSKEKKKRKKDKDDDGDREDWVERQRAMDPEGDGFLIWTSNRTGVFRVWRCELDGSGERMISPDEKDRAHVAPHISPDGKLVAFLSGPADGLYARGADYSLRIMDADGGAMRELAKQACLAPGGFRSAIWASNTELIFLDEEMRAVLLNIESGERKVLTGGGRYLVNRQLSHAFDRYFFHRYDPENLEVVRSGRKYGGCEGYFSHDGRWGIRMNGAGGPISRVDLATGELVDLLVKDDPRMPKSRNYMYFPMISRCGRLLAFSASRNRHDHSSSDYDVFVAKIDPETLMLEGDPIRYTFDVGTDRYPDIHLAELPLGRFSVEAPATVKFFDEGTVGGGRWDYGGGVEVSPGIGRFEKPGVYEVGREFKGMLERGKVTVNPAKPPSVISVALRGRRVLEVIFDEEVDPAAAEASLESGLGVKVVKSGGTRRIVLVELGEDFVRQKDKLSLSGVVDLAQEGNVMQPASFGISLPSWPADQRRAAFVWEGEYGNKEGAGAQACSVDPHAMAQIDRNGTMDLRGGYFTANDEAAARVLALCKDSGEFTIEAVLVPLGGRVEIWQPVVSFGGSPGAENFTLGMQSGRMAINVQDAEGKYRKLELCEFPDSGPQHVVVTYGENNAVCYINGEKVWETTAVAANFAGWSKGTLSFGSGTFETPGWSGKLDGAAIYGRALGAGEVLSNFSSATERWRAFATAEVESAGVKVELVAKASVPTLKEIEPYREGLFVCEFKVKEVFDGELGGVEIGKNVRVALWAIQDNRVMPITDADIGDVFSVRLEPFAAQRQLKSHYKSELLPQTFDPLMFMTGEMGE